VDREDGNVAGTLEFGETWLTCRSPQARRERIPAVAAYRWCPLPEPAVADGADGI
jgi:hypothetical protein